VWHGRCAHIHDAGEAQISPIQEMVAAPDDLRAGSGFAILEATTAG
jgi:hypothetical protein